MHAWIDAHCHVPHPRWDGAIDVVIRRAIAAGVSGMVCCSVNPDGWDALAALAEAYPEHVIPGFGMHPWFADRQPSDWERRLREHLSRPGAVLGEIGLDGMPGRPPPELQLSVARRQVELAREQRRPIVVHLVRAGAAAATLLAPYRNQPRDGFLVHGFSGSPEMVAQLAGWGAYFSVSGAILQPQRRRARQVALAIPSDRLLIETDAPFGPPARPDTVSEPADLPRIGAALAALRGVTVAQLSALSLSNTRRWLHPDHDAGQP